jgi:hypothetical protein
MVCTYFQLILVYSMHYTDVLYKLSFVLRNINIQ